MAQQEDRAPLAPPVPALSEGFVRTVKNMLRGIALLRESPLAMVGAFIVLFWVLAAIFAPWIAPFSPNEFDYTAVADPTPNDVHPLGTDRTGRDQLAAACLRCAHGVDGGADRASLRLHRGLHLGRRRRLFRGPGSTI